MKKLMTVILVLAGAFYAGYKGYVWTRASAALTLFKQALAEQGAMEYRWISSSLKGELRIENVRLVSFKLKETLDAEALVVRAPGPLALIQILDQLALGQWPERLEWRLEGGRLELDSPALAEHLENPLVRAASRVACSQGHSLDWVTWRAMGYGHVEGELSGTLRRDPGGRDLRLGLYLELENLGQLESEIRLIPEAPSEGKTSAIRPVSRLAALRLNMRDDGFLGRLMHHCRRLADLSEEQYLDRSLAFWEQDLTALGIAPSSDFKQAYRMWLQGNRQLFLELTPPAGLGYEQLAGLAPDEFQNQLGLNLRVDDHVVRKWASRWDAHQLKAMLTPGPELVEPVALAPPTEPSSAQSRFRPTDPEQLGDYLQYPIRLTTGHGRLYEGRLVAVDDDRGLQVEAMVSGGTITYPVPWADVEQVEIYRP